MAHSLPEARTGSAGDDRVTATSPERASTIAPTVAAVAVTAVAITASISALVLSFLWDVEIRDRTAVLSVLYSLVGVPLVRRHPRNAIGWLLLAIGLLQGIASLASAWAPISLDELSGGAPGGLRLGQIAAWTGDGLWILPHGLQVTFLLLLFPDGRLPSKRWLPVAALAAFAVGAQLAAPLTVLPQVWQRTSYFEFYPDERLAATIGSAGYELVRIAGAMCFISLVWRLRSMPASTRGTYLWFAVGALISVALLLPANFMSEQAESVLLPIGVASLPVGAFVAIVRHRAYGINVVINRALVYTLLSVALVGVYLAAAAMVEIAFGASSALASVAGAAATAVLLSPLRQWLQLWFDRFFYGARTEPHRVVSEVGNTLQAIASGEEALAGVANHVAAALRLPYVGLEVYTPDGPRSLACSGVAPRRTEQLPLIVNRETVGTLCVAPRRGQDRLSARDISALEAVTPIAAAAVRQVQLTDDLRRARGRLAAALEEERRRIRRDLHDGLGPSLAAVVMGLEHLRAIHRKSPDEAESLLMGLKHETQQAIDDIRTLVYGLRPPALDELSLSAALRQLTEGTVGRTGLEVDLDAPVALPDLPAAVEVAAYRIVQEALTNAARHSGAGTVKVNVDLECDGALIVAIKDDGGGLPDRISPGVGLTSMRERAEDIGGSLTISSDPSGTWVRAVLPAQAL